MNICFSQEQEGSGESGGRWLCLEGTASSLHLLYCHIFSSPFMCDCLSSLFSFHFSSLSSRQRLSESLTNASLLWCLVINLVRTITAMPARTKNSPTQQCPSCVSTLLMTPSLPKMVSRQQEKMDIVLDLQFLMWLSFVAMFQRKKTPTRSTRYISLHLNVKSVSDFMFGCMFPA